MSKSTQDVMIQLDHVSKVYAGHSEPAVDDFSMDIPRGEIVIFLGPSGCGKTTTLKMINRLIEPSGGRIILNGEDVTRVDVNQLRRKIGYVIQQIGLFPHMTIEDNIGLVPKMLGWPQSQLKGRVGELLEMVGLNPDTYRKRYPKQLSGGQQQRVGVARALAADPPVLLMDEPFGATDPIIREHLQDELLQIQAKVKKTMVFVTHDIDEALRLGNRIAILREQSRIAQYAPPDEILAHPANEFVSNFIGSGVSLKRLQVIPLRSVKLQSWPQVSADDKTQRQAVVVENNAVTGVMREGKLFPAPTVSVFGMLHTALDRLLLSESRAVCVVDDQQRYIGVITIDTIMDELRSTHYSTRYDAPTGASA
ncbi:MAG: ABC transporter ATP-binding protein [Phototrophicaceae bacterium]